MWQTFLSRIKFRKERQRWSTFCLKNSTLDLFAWLFIVQSWIHFVELVLEILQESSGLSENMICHKPKLFVMFSSSKLSDRYGGAPFWRGQSLLEDLAGHALHPRRGAQRHGHHGGEVPRQVRSQLLARNLNLLRLSRRDQQCQKATLVYLCFSFLKLLTKLSWLFLG